MKMQRSLLAVFLCSFALTVLVHAQSQSDFISIDCGLSTDSFYTDLNTNITYSSDANFTENGVNKNISSPGYDTSSLESQYLNVRSFPEGLRNCYTLKPAKGRGDKYLIRASFMYGNYDELDIPPIFDLYLGVNKWDMVKLDNATAKVRKEIIHTPETDYIDVCLVNIDSGTPFISVLELRLMKNSVYEAQSNKSLVLYNRWDVGSIDNETIRYYNDIYDRIWYPFNFAGTKQINNTRDVQIRNNNDFQPPSAVMRTAITPRNDKNSLNFSWEPENPDDEFYVYLHFAELKELQHNDLREFEIHYNGNSWYGPLDPDYLYAITVYSISPISASKIEFSLQQTSNSTLPPIINAVEIYMAKNLSQSQTDEQDVDAMMNIKSTYRVTRNWQGDPCVPRTYLWVGLNCSYNGSNPPLVISLNLSSSGLIGVIDGNISNLISIQNLDLSNNNLTGTVPEFLTQLRFLKVLNLKGNKLSGSIPVQLVERRNNGSLTLSVDEDLIQCLPGSCERNNNDNNNIIIISVVASVAALFILLVILGILWNIKRQKKQVSKVDTTPTNNGGSQESNNRVFTYSEVLRMTNNFERILGKGGFGTVYHGFLDDTQVAVKMLSSSSVQGYKEFQTEAELLMKVHHTNLTTLVGYCNEETNKGLVYEYMANGALEKHLTDKNVSILSWEDRIRIALDAAQGLEYLHCGCNPLIIHRDVKSSNILLNENFQAKLADFGLSRIFPVEGDTHVPAVVVGTPGYLDPEYYVTNWLNEKSDVYSFGIVLLEIITSRPVITRTEEKTHIIQSVGLMLGKGDIPNIADPRLNGDFDINSIWKAAKIAMACVYIIPANRPTMNSVVTELKDCLALEMARTKQDRHIETKDSTELTSKNFDSEMTQIAK